MPPKENEVELSELYALEEQVEDLKYALYDARKQLKNAIIIPDGATNGDMLLELLAGQHDKIHPVGDTQMGITLDCEWWNALYKKEV